MVALDVFDKAEGAGAEDVVDRKERVLFELGGAVDRIPLRGEVFEHRRLGPFQMKDDGKRIRRIDRADRCIIHSAHRNNSRRRPNDPFVACLNVLRGQRRAVVKQYVGMQLERIGKPVGRDRPRLRKITFDVWIVRRIELKQSRVVRRDRVQSRKRNVGMAVVIGGLCVDREIQHAAAFRNGVGHGSQSGKRGNDQARRDRQQRPPPSARRGPSGWGRMGRSSHVRRGYGYYRASARLHATGPGLFPIAGTG